MGLARQGIISIKIPVIYYLLGAFGPFVSTLIISASYRRKSPWPIVRNLIRLNTSPSNYLYAVAIPLSAQIIAIVVVASWFGPIPELKFNSPLVVITMFASFLIVSAGEETGWRGFALPTLQTRWSPTIATVIVWLMWGIWHIPAFFIGFKFDSAAMFVGMLLGFFLLLLPVSFLFTWVFNRSQGTTMTCVVMHAAVAGASGASNLAGLKPLEFFSVYGSVFALMAICLFASGTWRSASFVQLNLETGDVEEPSLEREVQ